MSISPIAAGAPVLTKSGRGLDRNRRVVIHDVEVTSDGWHVLGRTTFDYRRRDGCRETQQRETYDRGNGAVILLYGSDRRTVLLTRQFRLPAYVNDHPDGLLIEAAAGLLDDQDPETAIRRETHEELGVTLGALRHIYEVYMSPGSVTERLHFYTAPYTRAARTNAGVGVTEEGEDIEILELPYDDALAMITDGRIADGKRSCSSTGQLSTDHFTTATKTHHASGGPRCYTRKQRAGHPHYAKTVVALGGGPSSRGLAASSPGRAKRL